MFVDVCFPKENEKEFVDVANKLKTYGLIFVYNDKETSQKSFVKSGKLKTYSGLLLKDKNKQSGSFDLVFTTTFAVGKKLHKKMVYFYEKYGEKHSFHAPIKSINQVIIKDIKKNNSMVALSFYQLLNCVKNPRLFEELTFIVKLCEKYNVKLCIASFAHSPLELRSESDLMSLSKFFGMHTKNVKKSVSSLRSFLTP